jgi:hypothetical protein
MGGELRRWCIPCSLCLVMLLGGCSKSGSDSGSVSFKERILNCAGFTGAEIATYMKNNYPRIVVKDVKLIKKVGNCNTFSAVVAETGETLIGVTTITGASKLTGSVDLQILSYRSDAASENVINNMCTQNTAAKPLRRNVRSDTNVSVGNGQVYDLSTNRPLLGEGGRPLTYEEYKNGAKYIDPNHPQWPAQ